MKWWLSSQRRNMLQKPFPYLCKLESTYVIITLRVTWSLDNCLRTLYVLKNSTMNAAILNRAVQPSFFIVT